MKWIRFKKKNKPMGKVLAIYRDTIIIAEYINRFKKLENYSEYDTTPAEYCDVNDFYIRKGWYEWTSQGSIFLDGVSIKLWQHLPKC